MKHNRYAPPTAPVADISANTPLVKRPLQVAVAVALLWISMGVALAYVIAWLHQTPQPILLVFILLLSWLVYKISQGRNWARMTLLLLVVFGLVAIGLRFQRLTALNPVLSAIQVVQTALQCASLYLLFTGPGRDWFRSPTGS